ncbi:hypothetical protein [Streptomyces fumanus]|uniref:hypothetical protein n=1 Tax=Streptomyces fumanus TaxID=67302 RepID=UPI0027E52BF2|nr:hypothetical protein [Streptomyces fumanus]
MIDVAAVALLDAVKDPPTERAQPFQLSPDPTLAVEPGEPVVPFRGLSQQLCPQPLCR